jgi:hypothetical protein
MSEQTLPAFFPDGPLKVPLALRYVRRRIDKNRAQLWIIVCFAMQEEKARLGRDREADLISKLETTAAFESLLGQEDLDMAQELSLILGREPSKDRKVTCESGSPPWWNRLSAQGSTPTPLQKPEKHAGN